MYKVYDYCLSSVFVINTTQKTMFQCYSGSIAKNMVDINDEAITQQITKATINKHKQSYKGSNSYVIAPYLLSTFALEEYCNNDYFMKYHHEKKLICTFEKWENVVEFFQQLLEITKPYFEKFSTCNDWADIIENYLKLKNGFSQWDIDTITKEIEKEKTDEYYIKNPHYKPYTQKQYMYKLFESMIKEDNTKEKQQQAK